MAHNLNKQGDRYAFASAKEKAWHGLGTILPERMDSATAIREALLNYTVDKTPVQIQLPGSDKLIEVPGKFVTYRTDTGVPFGVVGNRYEIVQNLDAFRFFDAIVGEGAAIFETAGALHNGEVVFITAKLPDYIKVGKDDLIEQYIFLQSTHDGTGSIIAAFTNTRIVCENTMNIALGNMSNKVMIRHTRDAKAKLEQAHKIMGISNMMASELDVIFNKMAKKSIVDKDLRKYIEKVMLPEKKEQMSQEEFSTRFKNTVNSIMSYAVNDSTQQNNTTLGTVFGAMNSISGYFQNVKKYNSADDKLSSIISGDASNKMQKAFDLAVKMI